MRRFVGVACALTCVLSLLLVGCRKAPADGYQLELTLPESRPAPEWAPDRVSKLTVDGEDFSEPRDVNRVLSVRAAGGGNPTVKVVYSFWPNTYTNVVRTKTVTLDADRVVQVDFRAEDPATPDLIMPVYVPTSIEVVDQMCKIAEVGPDDVVYDIGCGDGRLVTHAVKKFGAKRGIGIDINADLVKKSQDNAKDLGLMDKASFRAANALDIKDYSEASVVFVYLGQLLNEKVKPALKGTLKSGARVVSHRFLMGDDWPPEKSEPIVSENEHERGHDLHLWRIK